MMGGGAFKAARQGGGNPTLIGFSGQRATTRVPTGLAVQSACCISFFNSSTTNAIASSMGIWNVAPAARA